MGLLLARLAEIIDAAPREAADVLEAAVCEDKHRKAGELVGDFARQVGGDRWTAERAPLHREPFVGAVFPPLS